MTIATKLARYFYTLLIIIFAPAATIFFWLRTHKQKFGGHVFERFGFIGIKADVWIHASSVGEAKAAAPFVEEIKNRYPEIKVVVSTMTYTGYLEIQRKWNGSVPHFFFGFDIPWVWQKILKIMQPKKIVILERETWPNLICKCRQMGVEIYVINAKFSERSAKKSNFFKILIVPTLKQIKLFFAQSKSDCEGLIEFGVARSKCQVVGNLKFDVKVKNDNFVPANKIKADLGQRPVWVAGSTHEGEEEFLLKIHSKITAAIPNALLVIAPRHPERFTLVWQLIKRYGLAGRYSVGTDLNNVNILLLDTMGDLVNFYACADVCFVGGSINPQIGGHNLLEPAALKKPILTGLYTAEIEHITLLLEANDALLRVDSVNLGSNLLIDLLSNPDKAQEYGDNAYQTLVSNQGATQACIDGIFN